jgi:hypothetical protein
VWETVLHCQEPFAGLVEAPINLSRYQHQATLSAFNTSVSSAAKVGIHL